MLAILSPAKTLDFDSPLTTDQHSAPEFTKESKALIKTLRQLEPSDIGSLMGISDKLATLNHDRYAHWSAKFDDASGARASLLAFISLGMILARTPFVISRRAKKSKP